MAATIDDLEHILKSVDKNTGGFRKTVNQGVNIIKKKLEDIEKSSNGIKNIIQSNNSTTNVRNIASTVGEINGHVKNINVKVTKSVDKIEGHTKDVVTFLSKIEKHIGNIPTTNNVRNSNNNGNFRNINTTIGKILKELEDIHEELSSKLSNNTGNSKLDAKILANKKIYENEKNFSLRKKALEEGKLYNKNGNELKTGSKNWISEKQKLEKEIKEREKLKKKYKDKKSFNEKAAGFAKGTFNLGTSIIKDKPDSTAMLGKSTDWAAGALSKAGPWGAVFGAFMQAVKALFDLGAKQDKATTEFARAIGGYQKGKNAVGESVGSMIDTADIKRGYTAEAAYSAMTEIAEARGRTTERLTPEAIKSAIDLKRFGIGAESVNNFDTFGKSLEETDKYFAKLYSEVSKKGLSFKNVSKAVNDNLKAAQSHTFANGLRGLEAMAERSVQLKYNMQQVFQFADKVSDIEGAIGTAANLSVLGGTFAQYSNPMQLLYEGLNDTEALQKRFENIFADKAQWNSKTGQIDMTGQQREFVKQGAKAMGISPDEAISMAMNQAKFKRVESQIGKGLGKDTTDYIKNIAELDKKGNAFVSLNGEQVAVSALTEEHKSALEKESQAKDKADNAKLGDIYQSTMSITDKMDNILVYLQERLGRWVYGIFNRFVGKDNNEVARGSGSEEIQNMREKLFNAYSGTEPGKYAKYLASKDETELKGLMKDKGMAANGINPNFSKPGDSGFVSGNSHLKGGIDVMYGKKLYNFEGGEHVTPKLQSKMYNNELTQIKNGTFNPYSYSNELIKNDMNRYFNQLKVAPVQNMANVQNTPVSSNAVNGRIKIDIPETITINLAGGEKIGEYDVREIVMTYIDKFMKEATMRKNFSGFNKEEFYNKSNVI